MVGIEDGNKCNSYEKDKILKIGLFVKSRYFFGKLRNSLELWQIFFELVVFSRDIIGFVPHKRDSVFLALITLYYRYYILVHYFEKKKFRRTKFFGAQILGTNSKFRQFCRPKIFYPLFYVNNILIFFDGMCHISADQISIV